MAAEVKTGTVLLPATTGNFSVTGLGFQPKFLIIQGHSGTDDYNVTGGENHWYDSTGYTDGTWQYAQCVNGKRTTSYTGKVVDKSYVLLLSQATGVDTWNTIISASLVSLDSDGFTLNIDATDGTQRYCSYIAFGKHIRATYQEDVVVPGATGAYSYTTCAFQPDHVIVEGLNMSATDNTGIVLGQHSKGELALPHDTMREFNLTGGLTSYSCNASGTTRSNRHQRASLLKLSIFNSAVTNNVYNQGNIQNFVLNGYKFQWSNVDVNGTYHFFFPIKGFQSFVGSFNTPTASTGAVSYTVGFKPDLIMFYGYGRAAALGIQRNMGNSIGCTDGTNEWGEAFYLTDGSGIGAVVNEYLSIDSGAYSAHCVICTAGVGAGITTSAYLQSLDTSGFTLYYDVVNAAQIFQVRYVAYKMRPDGGVPNIMIGSN